MHLYEQIRDVNMAMQDWSRTGLISVAITFPILGTLDGVFRFITFVWYTICYTALKLYCGIFWCSCLQHGGSISSRKKKQYQISIILNPIIAQMPPEILSKFTAASKLTISWHSQV